MTLNCLLLPFVPAEAVCAHLGAARRCVVGDGQSGATALPPPLRAKAFTYLGVVRECVAGRWAEQCHNVPSPLVGEGQGEGYNSAALVCIYDPISPAP